MTTPNIVSDPTPDNVPPYMRDLLWGADGRVSNAVVFMRTALHDVGVTRADHPRTWTRTNDIYRRYVAECEIRRHRPFNPQTFGVALRLLYPGVLRVHRTVQGKRACGYTLDSPWSITSKPGQRPKRKTKRERAEQKSTSPITDEVRNDLKNFH